MAKIWGLQKLLRWGYGDNQVSTTKDQLGALAENESLSFHLYYSPQRVLDLQGQHHWGIPGSIADSHAQHRKLEREAS